MPTPHADIKINPEMEAQAFFAENEGVFTQENIQDLDSFAEEILKDFENLEDVKRVPPLSKEQLERLVSMRHSLKKTSIEIKAIRAADLILSKKIPLTEADKKLLKIHKEQLNDIVKEVFVAACASKISTAKLTEFAEKFEIKNFDAVTNKAGLNPLCAAVLGNRNAEGMQYFLSVCNINARLPNGDHVGHFAANVGADKEMIKTLLKAQPELTNATNGVGLTMRDIMALKGNEKLLKELDDENLGLEHSEKFRDAMSAKKAQRGRGNGRARVKGEGDEEEEESKDKAALAAKMKAEKAQEIAEKNAERMAQEAARIQQSMDALAIHEEQMQAAKKAAKITAAEEQILSEKQAAELVKLKVEQQQLLAEKQVAQERELVNQNAQAKLADKAAEELAAQNNPQNKLETVTRAEEKKDQPKQELADVLTKLLNGTLDELPSPKDLGEFLIDAVLAGNSIVASSLIMMGASPHYERNGKSALDHMIKGDASMKNIVSIVASPAEIERANSKALIIPAQEKFIQESKIVAQNSVPTETSAKRNAEPEKDNHKSAVDLTEKKLTNDGRHNSVQTPSTICQSRGDVVKLTEMSLNKSAIIR